MKTTKTFLHSMLCLMVCLAVSGCSDMYFVDAEQPVPENDPREDIRLTNIQTEMTSGGLVQHKVAGGQAIFSQVTNRLVINDIDVVTMEGEQTTQGIIRSDMGLLYMANDASAGRARGDMDFVGDVNYRAPNKADPTTDSIQMRAESILWNDAEEKFRSPSKYEMILFPKGSRAIRQTGKGFETTQDLSRFVVKAGQVSTRLPDEPLLDRDAFLAEFKRLGEMAEEERKNLPKRPPPIDVKGIMER